MRLINTSTYQLEDHITPKAYAILSHTWRDEEVLYADFKTRSCQQMQGYRKIEYLCKQAREDNLEYVWIDTACINKESSTELSEAINSMFEWYQKAKVCYVFIDDGDNVEDIKSSRWITRGWTLQELIAPTSVTFFSREWTQLGTKRSLISKLVQWTGIDQLVLEYPFYINQISAATRMSWVASRSTTRVEDMAYCLLGVFGVNMPLIYGEKDRAFRRLQEEILKQCRDISILAFDRTEIKSGTSRLLAASPCAFRSTRKIINEEVIRHCKVRNGALETSLALVRQPDYTFWAILPCRFEFDYQKRIALRVHRRQVGDVFELHAETAPVEVVIGDDWIGVPQQKVLIDDGPPLHETADAFTAVRRLFCRLDAHSLLLHGYEFISAEPSHGVGSWDKETMTLEVATNSDDLLIKFGVVHRDHAEAFIVIILIVGDEHFLGAKAKPATVDIEPWLIAERMFVIPDRRNTSAHFGGPFLKRRSTMNIRDVVLERMRRSERDQYAYSKRYNCLRLLSGTCIEYLSLKTKYLDGPGLLRGVELYIRPHKTDNWGVSSDKYHAGNGLGEFEIVDLDLGCRAGAHDYNSDEDDIEIVSDAAPVS